MSKAYNSAVSLLARREHGYAELADKLTKKGYEVGDIESALTKLKDLGLQSDARYVEMFCRSRISQGYGPTRILNELKSKNIDSDLIETQLAAESENWVSYAIDVWRKKYKQPIEYSFIERQKQKQFLLYRGFSMDTISLVFECLT